MRTTRNLVWFLLAFGLTVFSGLAFAQDTYHVAQILGYSGYAVDRNPACQQAFDKSAAGGNYTKNMIFTGSTLATKQCLAKPSATGSNQVVGTYEARTCTTAQPYFNGVNGCSANPPVGPEPEPEPEQPPPGSCKPGDITTVTYKNGPKGIAFGQGYNPFYPKKPHDGQCELDCSAPGTEVKECFSREGFDYCTYTCAKTGNVKSSTANEDAPAGPRVSTDPRTDVPPFESPKGPCPRGTVNIGTNSDGVPICAGTGADPENKPAPPPKIETEKTETAEDGTKTTTKTETTKNSDGSETVTKTITIIRPDGTKQTDNVKEVGKTPAGTPGKDDSKKDDEKFDLCKQNPNLSICKNSSVTGTCGAIACTGDAIQCATLRAAAAMQCKQKTDDEELKASDSFKLGSSVLAGNDPMNGDLPVPGKGAVIDVPTLKADGWLGGGAAFDDFSFTVQGNTIVVPLSQLTKYFLMFRYALMVVASMISFRILSGAILRE